MPRMTLEDLEQNERMRSYFTGLAVPCPSRYCDGFLTEFDQVSMEPFKAFLVCPKCESRLAVMKRLDWEAREHIRTPSL